MTIEQFRTDPQLPGMWSNLLSTNVILQTVLSLMEDNHPARFTVHPDNDGDLSPTRAAVELGMTRGYSKYGDTLKLLAKAKTKSIDIGETTYEKEVTSNG